MSGRAFGLPSRVRKAIVAHARAARPRECCGLLLGVGARAMFAVPMTNIAEGNTRYRIDDAAHLALRRTIRGFVPALTIVGVYHSHPAHDARPSPTDVAEAMYPDWIYVIVGLKGGRARVEGFRIRGQNVRRLAMRGR